MQTYAITIKVMYYEFHNIYIQQSTLLVPGSTHWGRETNAAILSIGPLNYILMKC